MDRIKPKLKKWGGFLLSVCMALCWSVFLLQGALPSANSGRLFSSENREKETCPAVPALFTGRVSGTDDVLEFPMIRNAEAAAEALQEAAAECTAELEESTGPEAVKTQMKIGSSASKSSRPSGSGKSGQKENPKKNTKKKGWGKWTRRPPEDGLPVVLPALK